MSWIELERMSTAGARPSSSVVTLSSSTWSGTLIWYPHLPHLRYFLNLAGLVAASRDQCDGVLSDHLATLLLWIMDLKWQWQVSLENCA